MLAGQGALPILYNTPPIDLLAQLLKNGEVLDIESTFQQLGVSQELVPAAVALLKKIYGSTLTTLPFELNIEGFWYNKQIFAQNNIQPPQTWDQLVQIAASLQQKGIQPFTASGTQGWPITRLIGNYLFRKLGPRCHGQREERPGKADRPELMSRPLRPSPTWVSRATSAKAWPRSITSRQWICS